MQFRVAMELEKNGSSHHALKESGKLKTITIDNVLFSLIVIDLKEETKKFQYETNIIEHRINVLNYFYEESLAIR